MARIPLQCNAFAPVYAKARDAALTPDLSEATIEALMDARRFQPPSKAKLRKHEKHARGASFVERKADPRLPTEETMRLREQREFLKRVLADCGGSITIAPSDDGTLYNMSERGLLNYVEPVQRRAHSYPTQSEIMAEEDRKLAAEKRRLQEAFDRERARVETVFERYERAMATVFGDA